MAERFTDFQLTYNMVDVTAKEDVRLVDWSNVYTASSEHIVENTPFDDILSASTNSSILDGSLSEFDVGNDYGLIADNFVEITIETSEYHSTSGLTLYFRGDPPEWIRLEYYRNGVSLGIFDYNYDDEEHFVYNLSEMYTNINGAYRFVSKNDVSLWDKIVITIENPWSDHYIKLQGVVFGFALDWDENNLKQGTLVQEMNRISDLISINTLNFEVIDLENKFNFGNPNGLHKYFQRKQELLPKEIIETVDDEGNVDTKEIQLGKFYLDTYSNELNLGKFSAVSFMGLMDGIAFNEGAMYNGVRAKVIIDKIFEVAGLSTDEYEIDSVTTNQLLYGTIAPTTCRDALKQVLFACHSILDSTDSQNSIKICKSSTAQIYSITRGTKITTKVTRDPYISGVEIDYPEYTLKTTERAELHKDTYNAGGYTVIFTTPCDPSSVEVTNRYAENLLEEASTYYVRFHTARDNDEITITGYAYELKQHKVIKSRDYIDPGEMENIKKFNTTLCNSAMAANLANTLLQNFISQNLTLEIKHIADDTSMNDLRTIQNEIEGLDSYMGVFTNRTFDLTGGFVDTCKLEAYFSTQDYNYYTGDELIADSNIII